MHQACRRAVLVVAVLTGLVGSASAQTSTFASDADGWGVVSFPGDPYTSPLGVYAPTWDPVSGNPGGCITMWDPDSGWWFFSAPSKFIGDKSACFGGTLSYDVRVLSASIPDNKAPLVVLAGGGHQLYYWGAAPAFAWTGYSVALDSTGGWLWDSSLGPVATDAQIKSVLGSTTGLFIRGEYYDGADQEGLDNVKLTCAVPEGACLPLLPLLAALVPPLRRRR